MNDLVIASTSIRQDAQGRFNLNDLHRAAGAARRHSPAAWLQNQQTRDLIGAIAAESLSDTEIPVSVVRGGRSQGTYVCDDMVIAYATWISPKFYLKVIRAYRASTGKELRQTVGLLGQRLALETKDASSKVKGTIGSRLMNERRRELPAIRAERAELETVMQPELFTSFKETSHAPR